MPKSKRQIDSDIKSGVTTVSGLKVIKPLSLVTASMFKRARFDESLYWQVLTSLKTPLFKNQILDYALFEIADNGELRPLTIEKNLFLVDIMDPNISDEDIANANERLIEFRFNRGIVYQDYVFRGDGTRRKVINAVWRTEYSMIKNRYALLGKVERNGEIYGFVYQMLYRRYPYLDFKELEQCNRNFREWVRTLDPIVFERPEPLRSCAVRKMLNINFVCDHDDYEFGPNV